MEMFGKTLCITFDELVRSGIMSKSNFDKHVRERKFQVLQKGGNGRKVLVAYETLSDALRSVVEKKLPDIKKQLKKGQTNPMNIRLKSDDKYHNHADGQCRTQYGNPCYDGILAQVI